jgi:HD-like signal output (HDOD) protein
MSAKARRRPSWKKANKIAVFTLNIVVEETGEIRPVRYTGGEAVFMRNMLKELGEKVMTESIQRGFKELINLHDAFHEDLKNHDMGDVNSYGKYL